MPEDKPYIQKIYNFLNVAYGQNGQLSAGAFTNDFNSFYDKITTNDKYANKIYGALNAAYGPEGKLKKGAFSLKEDSFYDKVMLPKQKEPIGVLAPQEQQQQKYYETQPVSQTTTVDPNEALLSSVKDIPQTLIMDKDGVLKEKKSPGLMTDISAFDPLIEESNKQKQTALESFNNQLTDTTTKIDPLTGKEIPLSDFQFQMRNKLRQMEEVDKNLQVEQKKADEFAQTTAGGLYYSFVRPIYKTMLSAGKNTTALALRAAGDLGESIGLDESKQILDKTADGLVDYFDFNRLAREGNTAGYLNLEPTYQQGKLSKKNILPRAVEAISSMATLMGGARALGGGTPGLFASSYAITYEDYRQQAKRAGLNNEEADRFAITSAGVTSALEMISPNRFLLGGGTSWAGKGVFKAIKDGVPVGAAIKNGLKESFKEIGKENIQELSQLIGDKIVMTGNDLVSGKNNFDPGGILPTAQEALETVALTTIATGVLSARHISHNSNPSAIERSAWTQAAENIEKFDQTVKSAIQEGTIDPHAGRRIIERANEYKELYDALIDHGYNSDRASAIAIEGVKAKRIQERAKPLSGIKSLKNITTADEEAQNQIEQNIADIESGVRPAGEEYSSDYVREVLNDNGASEKTDKLSKNGYKTVDIDLTELYKNNKEFKEYVDNGLLRPSGDKTGLKVPAVINEGDVIVDGMNRLAQHYIDGSKTARVFKEMRSPFVHVESNVSKPRVVPTPKSTINISRPSAPNIIQPLANESSIPEDAQNTQEYPVITTRKNPVQDIFDESKSSASILGEVSKLTTDPLIKSSAASLMPYLKNNPDIRFNKMFTIGNGEAMRTGDWTARLAGIRDDNKLAQVVVHELYHTISMNEIDKNESFRHNINNIINEAREKLKLDAEYFDVPNIEFSSGGKRNRNHYGLLNEHEFISEIFTNKEFAKLIDDINVTPKKTLLEKLSDYLSTIVGGKNRKSASEQIRKMILKGLPKEVALSKDELDVQIANAAKGAARESDYIYNPIIEFSNQAIEPQTNSNAIQVESTTTPDVRPSPTNSEGVGKGNQELQVTAREGQIGNEALSQSQEEIEKIKKPNSTEEAKIRRDKAVSRLKTAYNNLGNIGIAFDAERTAKQQIEFNKALVGFIKEEILYRANQIKGFAKYKKAQIRTAISRAIRAEGIKPGTTEFNNAFEEAYKQIRTIPGVLGKNLDRITFKEYIKSKIKARERGFKEGLEVGRQEGVAKGNAIGAKKGETTGAINARERVKNTQRAILDAIKGTGIRLSIQQLRRISAITQQATTSSDMSKTLNRAVDVATQMVWEAKNKQKISHTRNLIKQINSMRKSPSMALNDIEWIKQLSLPSPNKVDDIDTYMEMLSDYLHSRRANNESPKYTREDIADFVENENDRIYNEKRKGQQDELDELISKGMMPADISLDEYLSLLDYQSPDKASESINKKAEIIKEFVRPKMADFRFRLRNIGQPGNVDPLFDLMSDQQRDVVKKVSEIDINTLKAADLIKLNNVLNNISEDGTVDGAGQLITSYESLNDVSELADSKAKIRELPSQKVINKKNISNIMSALSYNDMAISRLRDKTLGGIERKLSPAFKHVQSVVNQFVNLNKRHKIDAQSNAKLHAYSYINQYKGIEKGEISDALNTKLDELIDDIHYVFSEGKRIAGRRGRDLRQDANYRIKALEDMGLITHSITDGKLEIKKNNVFEANNPEKDLKKAYKSLSKGERAVYNYVLNRYASLSDQLEFITRTYTNKEFRRERNYVSLVAKQKDGSSFNDQELSDNTDITFNARSLNNKPSGTTMTRADHKPSNVYYDGDFFSNFVNRYYQSVYTAKVLPDLQRVAKVVNNDDFKRFITGRLDEGFKGKGAENYPKFKGKLAQVINEGKYSPFLKSVNGSFWDNTATGIISSGVKLALNNIWQGPKQLAPAIVHIFTIANPKATAYALGTSFKAIFDKTYNQDRSKFLSNFTGVKRVPLGSQAYESYVKKFSNAPGWWTSIRAASDKISKISGYSLEKGDQAAQNAAYISGYITSLLNQGKIKSISDFDFAKEAESPNPQALAFAEQIASAVNNESAREYKPDVLKDSDKATYLWMLQGFSLNAYQNAMNKAKIIWDNRSTGAERQEAALHFAGYLGEMATYQFIGKVARGLQFAVAGALLSTVLSQFGITLKDEDEEQKKARKQKEKIRTGANIAADIALSGTPAPIQAISKNLFNLGYQDWAKHEVKLKKAEAKGRGERFNPKGTYLSPYFVPFYGAEGPGGGAEFYSAAGKKVLEFASNQIGWTAEDDSKKSEEEKEIERIGQNLGVGMVAASIILRSGDVALINNKMQQQIKSATKDSGKAKGASGSAPRGRRSATRGRRRNNR